MFYKRNRLIQTVAVLMLAVMCAGCADQALLFPELTAEEVQGWAADESFEQSEETLGLERMKEVASDGGLRLYFNEKTTEIAVRTAEGTVWYSNPQDRLSLSDAARGRLSSPLLVNVIDSTDTVKQMNAYEDSVQYGQADYQSIPNGVRVTYRFGQVIPLPLYPQAFTAERFQEILSHLDETAQSNMKRYYREVNYEAITDTQTLNALEQSYANLAEAGRIYTLKQSVSPLEAERITEYLTVCGYTYEQREEDHALVGYTDEAKSLGNFVLPVEYTLQDGRLCVRIPVEDIRCTENVKLDSIVLLPYFCTGGGEQDCDVVLPDGSGAVVELDYVRSTSTPEYEEPIYGRNYGLYQSSVVSQKYVVSMPVYGILTQEGGLLAEITGAAATASLYVTPRTSADNRGGAAAKFQILDYAQVKLMATDTDTVNSYAEHINGEDISLQFSFLPSDGLSWDTVAQEYREQLLDRGVLRVQEEEALPLVVRMLGAIDDREPLLGVPREVIRPMTTFAQAQEMAEQLAEAFPDNQLVVRYSGWREGGLKAKALEKFDAEGVLGGRKGFMAMAEALARQGIQLFPDADFQYAYRSSFLGGFGSAGEPVRLITSEAAVKPTYNVANFLPNEDGMIGCLLRPESMAERAASFMESVGDIRLGGLSLPYLASDLSGNYDVNNYLSRNAAQEYSEKLLLQACQAGYTVMSEGVNIYALSGLTYAVNVPMESNAHPLLDRSIPFVQMVLSGSVRIAATELNAAADDRYYTLKCIETGSSVYATIMYAKSAEVKGTNYEGYYAAGYAVMKPRLEEVGKEVSQALRPFSGARMIGHTELTDGLIRVDYDNGGAILINYTDSDVQMDRGVVPAVGWMSVEGGGA